MTPRPDFAPASNSSLIPHPSAIPASSLVAAAKADLIRPGDILHARTYTPLAWAIRRSVGSWGCHDALVVRDNGELCIGDASPMKARCTPLADYDRRAAAGKVKFFVCRPANSRQKTEDSRQNEGTGTSGPTSDSCILTPDFSSVDDIHGMLAAYWWLQNVNGKPYDFGAYPRLFTKAILGDICQRAAGWEWAWYCTESCRDAWRNGAGIDPYTKNNPTPRTTEKRILSGALQIVWNPMPDFSLTSGKYTRQESGVRCQESEV